MISAHPESPLKKGGFAAAEKSRATGGAIFATLPNMQIVLATCHVRPSAQAIPLAAGCLAASLPPALRRACRLLDLFPARTEAEQLDAIVALHPDLVAFPCYAWNRTRIVALARRLRRSLPQIKLVVGGPEAGATADILLADDTFDAVVRGEGENSFPALVAALARGGDLAAIPGISRRDDQAVRHNSPAPAVDLATAVSPWLSGILTPPRAGGVLWETSRGCPFACDFCYDGRGERGVRPVPPARLTAELDLFVKAGVSQLWVLDSTFNYPAERGKALLRLLAERAPHLHVHLEAKADFLDRETARLLGKIPCSLQIGLQSARPEVLRNIHRSHDPSAFARQIGYLAEAGVAYGFDLIYGLPGDNHRGFCESLAGALRLGPNQLDLFPLALLPGTALAARRAEFALDADPAPPYEVRGSRSYSAADLAASRRLAAATDLFYNRGRAVPFFEPLLALCGDEAIPFLEGFAALVEGRGQLFGDDWSAERILPLQRDYVAERLARRGQRQHRKVIDDLIVYNYHYAETLLAPELPVPRSVTCDLWQRPWRCAPQLRLLDFSCDPEELLAAGRDLPRRLARLRPRPTTRLLLRRGNTVISEAIAPELARLLRGSDGRQTPASLWGGRTGDKRLGEILAFAVREGLLLPAAPGTSGDVRRDQRQKR